MAVGVRRNATAQDKRQGTVPGSTMRLAQLRGHGDRGGSKTGRAPRARCKKCTLFPQSPVPKYPEAPRQHSSSRKARDAAHGLHPGAVGKGARQKGQAGARNRKEGFAARIFRPADPSYPVGGRAGPRGPARRRQRGAQCAPRARAPCASECKRWHAPGGAARRGAPRIDRPSSSTPRGRVCGGNVPYQCLLEGFFDVLVPQAVACGATWLAFRF